MKVLKLSFCILLISLTFVGASLFSYWEQCWKRPSEHSLFRFGPEKLRRPYNPNTKTSASDHDKINRGDGFLGPLPQVGEKVIMSLGTCVGINLQQELQKLFKKHKRKWVARTGAKQHSSILEANLIFNEFLVEMKPDILLVNVGTLFYRDIEYYNKDFFSIPKPILEERSFSHWEGNYFDWLSFWAMKRRNQFYFAEDRKELEAVLVHHKVPSDEIVFKNAKKTIPYFKSEISKLAKGAHDAGIILILHTPPVYTGDGQTREIKMLKLFNTATLEAGKENNVEVIDLYEQCKDLDLSYFHREHYHFSDKGLATVGELIYQNLQKYLNVKRN